MKSIRSIVLKDFVYPEQVKSLIPPEEFVLFDIETTGLSHSHNHVILIGYIVFDGQDFILHQLFCENRNEERKILVEFQKVLEEKAYYISYNGRAFDIPFLNSRYKIHDIPCELKKYRNLDIMRLVKLNRDYFNLPDFKLKTVEKFLGIERQDTISGKESVELYDLYEKIQTHELEEKILLHNYEDILYLLKCLDIVKFAQLDSLYAESPVKIQFADISAFLMEIKTKGDQLTLVLQSENFSDREYYDYASVVTWAYNSSKNELTLTCPIFTLIIEGHSYQFADVDLMAYYDSQFNQMSYEDKMSHLITEAGVKKHYNIYRLISECFKHFHTNF